MFNYHQIVQYPGDFPLFGHPALGLLFVVLVLWDLGWKGYGLWLASRNNQPYWFIAILIINSVGILPIVYIYGFAAKKK